MTDLLSYHRADMPMLPLGRRVGPLIGLLLALGVLTAGCSSGTPDPDLAEAPTTSSVPDSDSAAEPGVIADEDGDGLVLDFSDVDLSEFGDEDPESPGSILEFDFSGVEPEQPDADNAAAPESGNAPESGPVATPSLEGLAAAAPPAAIDPDDREIMDEAGALTCAQAEFALDAVLSGDASSLSQFLGQAHEWAQQTGMPTIAATADLLDPNVGLAEGEAVVITVLTTCSEAGYEL